MYCVVECVDVFDVYGAVYVMCLMCVCGVFICDMFDVCVCCLFILCDMFDVCNVWCSV